MCTLNLVSIADTSNSRKEMQTNAQRKTTRKNWLYRDDCNENKYKKVECIAKYCLFSHYITV